MKIIYIIQPFYLPGENAGGPVHSIKNLIENLGKDYDFRIITRNHDFKENKPYEGIVSGEWIVYENFRIIYLEDKEYKIKNFRKIIKNMTGTIVYLQSYFSIATIYFMLARKIKLFNNVQFIVAPRGELSDGAMNIKRNKKRAFQIVAKKLYKGIIWQATNEKEKNEILNEFNDAKIVIANNIPVQFEPFEKKLKKEKGLLNTIFLSRISRKKNLKYLLDIIKNLPNIEGKFNLDIYGPLEDQVYFNECNELMNTINQRTGFTVNYKGSLDSSQVVDTIKKYHIFLFPTLDENFGHVILESLSAQTPLIMSDQTNFNDLEEYDIGFTFPLSEPEKYISTIVNFINMDQEEYNKYLLNFSTYIDKTINYTEIKRQYQKLFG